MTKGPLKVNGMKIKIHELTLYTSTQNIKPVQVENEPFSY